MKRLFVAAALSAGLVLTASSVAAQPAPGLAAAAIADPGRPAADIAKDADRHPAELIAFAGVRPGQSVMDVWTGSGYWSRLFGKIVGPNGKVFAYVPAEIASSKNEPFKIAQAMAAEPGRTNIQAVSDPIASPPPPEFQNTLDVVWIFENYHDLHNKFMKGADVDAYNRAVFQLLKPGGVYVVVDHAAPAGSGLKNTEDLHRIDPAAVRAEVEKAGFKFAGESKVLARPDDPRTAKVFDPSIRGKTDRFAYKFVKPR